MRKFLGIMFIAVFALSFVAGVLQSSAKAGIPCTAACINGQLRVCCYNAQHVYTCTWKGRCIID